MSINPQPCCLRSLGAVGRKNNKIFWYERDRRTKLSLRLTLTDMDKEIPFQFYFLLLHSVSISFCVAIIVPNLPLQKFFFLLPTLGDLKEQSYEFFMNVPWASPLIIKCASPWLQHLIREEDICH